MELICGAAEGKKNPKVDIQQQKTGDDGDVKLVQRKITLQVWTTRSIKPYRKIATKLMTMKMSS